ncbi:MAG: MATE family efflux transporter [Clostridiales Family XIII bacterium]|jgi:putative MATE family efflux protein|nr:MATE family efflux transporter [Clostridiales Family XIII bacterium]
MRRKHEQIITEESFYRKLARVALPISLQSLIASSLGLMDNLMVGNLGETELAAVGISTQIYFIFWMILFGFNGGTTTYMAQYWGKRDLKSIRQVTGIAITISFSFGVLLFIVCAFFPRAVLGVFTDIPEVLDMGMDYVRYGSAIFLTWSIVVPFTAAFKATQQTSIPLKISIIVFSTNTVLNAILIFGYFGAPKMGIMGACLATVISRCLELILYLFAVFVRRNIIAGPIREFFSWHKALFYRVIGNAIPTTVNEAMWGVGVALYNAAFGRMGVTEFAAVQAGNTIQNLFALACFSIGDAMLILVGEKLGRGELDEGYKLAGRIMKVAIVIGAGAGALLLISSKWIVGLFEFTPEGSRYATLILLIYGIFLFVKIHNATIITGVLRAGGDTKFAMFAEVACVWLIGVPVAFFFALYVKLPIYLVVLCVQAEETVKFFILRRRYKSKKWVRNLVNDMSQGEV